MLGCWRRLKKAVSYASNVSIIASILLANVSDDDEQLGGPVEMFRM